ncbi:Protein jag [Lentibacillus sp. JNUCC-1]|uniref:RNA-binding cell elongation regulator Jag/EloR n=1 Tax=Lentibacillus sp. JNUCC-1 TaxID=2654513 RepID=UPI00132AEA19|nr:Protein jag [Lentibacillus sp. JNUCC-1]
MRELTASGQTVEEAVQSALEQLNTTRDQVEIDVIDEGKKGLLGVFGSKPAFVKVMAKDADTEEPETAEAPSSDESHPEPEEELMDENDPIETGKDFITNVVAKMNMDVQVVVTVEGQYVTYTFEGDHLGKLIGKRGQTLNAMQYLVHLVVNKHADTRYAVILDAEGYRKRRQESLEGLAAKMADKAIYKKRKVALEPMPAFERKIIHNALQGHTGVTTTSDGRDPHRHVVIVPDQA